MGRNLTAEALRYGTHCRRASQFFLHTHVLIHEWKQLYLPLPSKLKLILIYCPQWDGRLSWPRHHCGE